MSTGLSAFIAVSKSSFTSLYPIMPGIGKGPFPGVLLIPGSGTIDKNETLGFVHKNVLNHLHRFGR